MKKALTFLSAFCLIFLSGMPLLAGNIDRLKPHTFQVSCKDIQSGRITELAYNTGETTRAQNAGLSGLTTPAYQGSLGEANLPKTYNFIRNRVPTNTKGYPFRAVCYIVAYFDTNQDGKLDDKDTCFTGSGFLTGPSAVATCAHLLYTREYGWCQKVEVYPAKDADYTPYESDALKVYVSAEWLKNFDANFDWGLLEIDYDFGNYLGWFGHHWRRWPLEDELVNATGYPGDKGTYQWRAPGIISTADDFLLEYNCDIRVGVSGAPVYDKNNVVLGINTYKADEISGGVRITEELYCFLNHFK